jgi:hypothetical protein
MMPSVRSWRLPAVILAIIGVVIAVPCIIFNARSPVLIVTDAPFVDLYGKSHLRSQRIAAERTLFRPVKPVIIADGAGPDIVSIAITTVSARPLCVLFPRSQAAAAQYFHEQLPAIRVVVLRGLVQAPQIQSPDGILCLYGTDRAADLYRAGLFVGILGNIPSKETPKTEETAELTAKTFVLWQDRQVNEAEKGLFSRGVQEIDASAAVLFVNNTAALPDMKVISGAVLTGAGGEFLERNPRMPVILFSWVDPALTAREVMVFFDDSVWALAVPAVRMALRGQAEGAIPSKPLILSRKIAHNGTVRALQNSAKKVP